MSCHRSIAAIAVLVLGLIAPCVAQTPKAAARQLELGALVKAAQAEKSLTWYMSTGEPVAIRVGNAFKAKYGIDAAFLRLSGGTLVQRHFAEAEAGRVAADVLVGTVFTDDVANTMIQKGWAESLSETGLPVFRGEFPADQNTGPTRVLGTAPWQIAYNRERVKKEELPQDWKDILNPRWKTRIIIPDPRSSPDTYLPFWHLLLSRYGEDFYKALREQNLRVYNSALPGIQALAAGEGDITFPIFSFNVLPVKATGAPVELANIRGGTTGNNTRIILTSRDKSPHPNAGRLFANFLLSREGNAAFNSDPGQVGPYNMKELPDDYQPPSADAIHQRDKFYRLLGLAK